MASNSKNKFKIGSENIFERLLNHILAVLILPLLYLLKPIINIKLVNIRADRIGHLASNTDLYFRRLQLKKNKDRIFYIGFSNKSCNKQLLDMYKRKMFIIESDFFRNVIITKVIAESKFFDTTTFEPDDFETFNNTDHPLKFINIEYLKGKRLLNQMGIKDNSWFVCFHSRDTTYLASFRGDIDCTYHDFRNSDISNYFDGVKYIISKGGYALRMGQVIEKELPSELKKDRIIDYATKCRSDCGDIYLLANCKFFLGNTSGIACVPYIFHRPIAIANVIPFIDIYQVPRKGDLFIPKKIWSMKKKRLLTFHEMLELGSFYVAEQYEKAGLKPIENTAEEILELTKEMNERIDGTFKPTKEDEELQKRFWSIFSPKDRAYGSPARIGAAFLRKNKELLD